MEVEFQTQQIEVSSTTRTINRSKFLGVRQRPSGKWVAEIKNTSQKIRMWLGTFDTAEEAARAYDEAACLLRGSNTRTNFVDHIPPSSALSLKIKNLLNHKKSLRQGHKETNVQNSASPAKTTSHFDDAYKPDLSNFSGGLDISNPRFDHLSCYNYVNNAFDHEYLSDQKDGNRGQSASANGDGNQISASLYASNEYWDNIHDSSSDAFWDLPLLCQS